VYKGSSRKNISDPISVVSIIIIIIIKKSKAIP
jgi:hypothetical protein